MTIPSAGQIETAFEMLKQKTQADLQAPLTEFSVSNVNRLRTTGPLGQLSSLDAGYLIGLETARVLAAEGERL